MRLFLKALSKCILVSACLVSLHFSAQSELYPEFETEPVINWNGADDPAIWLHPTITDSSFFIGVDKKPLGRLELYNYDGTRFWSTPATTKFNNVDVLYNFPLGTDTVDLVIGSNNNDNRLEIFQVNPDERILENITGNTDCGFTDLYGLCTYNDLCYDKYYVFLTRRTTDGKCYQYEITTNEEGTVDSELVRILNNLPTRTEGMVADVVLGHLYISEESVGIWKYGARPEDGIERILMDSVSGPNLTALVEGLTIYYASDSTGYFMSSSQGSDSFQVYTREGDNEYIGTFKLVENPFNGVDGCEFGDGIDVLSYPFTSHYPNGVFIAHDTSNDLGPSNYKIIAWDSIANALGLQMVNTVDPRLIAYNLCDTIDTTTVDTTVTFIGKIPGRIGLSLFPNPAGNYLNVGNVAANMEVRVYDSSGKLVLQTRLNNNSIYVGDLPKGIYILVAGGESAVFQREE